MTLLKRDAILKAQDIETKDVEVKEWGGSIRVRQMTVAERNEFSRKASSEDKDKVGAWLVTLLAVDESGGAMFKPEDIPDLEKRNFHALDTVVQAILEVNSLGEKQVEAAEKKS
jgi:hypothetical protein